MNKVDVTHILVFEYPHGMYKGIHNDKLDAMFGWCITNADVDWEYISPEIRNSSGEHYFAFKDGGTATMFALKFN
jgi:hypothetical protein